MLPTCHISPVGLGTHRPRRDATQGHYMAIPNVDEVKCAKYLSVCCVQITEILGWYKYSGKGEGIPGLRTVHKGGGGWPIPRCRLSQRRFFHSLLSHRMLSYWVSPYWILSYGVLCYSVHLTSGYPTGGRHTETVGIRASRRAELRWQTCSEPTMWLRLPLR